MPYLVQDPASDCSRPSGAAPTAFNPLVLGVVLSGGQAAGGHNCICGLFDYVHTSRCLHRACLCLLKRVFRAVLQFFERACVVFTHVFNGATD